VLASFASDAAAQARRPGGDDLARARVLDKEGVKAFGEGRYNDAIRYFDDAYRLGGPPFELWNIAKCHMKLDQPEQAAEMLEKYLATPNLPPDDRNEASEQLAELEKRPSTLTVSSAPSGAQVSVDGQPLATGTPVSTTVPPGKHTVTITGENRASYTRSVEAKYGRAVIVDAPLASDDRPPPPKNPYGTDEEDRRIALRALLALVLPRHGDVGGSAAPGGILKGTYRFTAPERALSLSAGALFAFNPDSWENTIGAPSAVKGCSETLPSSFSATALSFFAIGELGIPIVPRLRASGVGGLGIAGYAVPETGGDLFLPSCTSSPGVRPALLLGAEIDYAITSAVRLSAIPFMMHLQPAFAGVRSTPLDASGLWLRFDLGIGVGVDL